MFGFLIGNEVNDDAVALKKLTDMALNKYAALRYDDLAESVSRDFDEKHHHIDPHNVCFTFRELEGFQFCIKKSYREGAFNDISVFGRGKYAGILLQVTGGTNWSSSVTDGMAY